MSLVDAAIITGAGRGIGRSIALDLGKNGIPILCISKSSNAETTMLNIQRLGGKAECLILDIKNYNETKKILTEWTVKTTYKKLAVILAASILGPKGPFINCSLQDWDECQKVNVLGNLAVLQGVLPKMLENKFGRIVTFAGGGSAYAFPVFPAYSATKTAIVRITENLNEDLATKGDFSIVCLSPGAVETDMLKTVRQAGAEVKTVTDISEPVTFIREFVNSVSCNFSGAFIHVRDNWRDYLNSTANIADSSRWKLRRIE